MAAKSASIDSIFTQEELQRLDPGIKARIQTGIDQAILAGGGAVKDPALTKQNFEKVKRELLSAQPGEITPIDKL